ncbi:MAG: glycosyltransferase family 2 protein [Bacteroidota bacterium]|nr:glycosyltransferase family 2 protein [Bacteroidota bacterium]
MDKTLSNTTPFISVLMPVYNGEKYLREAIDSILNQSYPNFEFIVINDGSIDSTESIILSYNDNRIRYIKNEINLGLIQTLNNGFAIAKGKYVARMDADDISLPNRLKHQLEFMLLHPEVGVCGCDYVQFSGAVKKHHTAFYKHDEIFGFMLFNSSIIHPSLLIKKEVLQNINPIFDSNYKHAEDFELWAKLVFTTKFSAIQSTEFEYRLHKSQVTTVHKAEQINSANKVRKTILQKAGFVFSENELAIHCKIGSSQRFTSFAELQQVENWLKKIVEQNQTLKIIDEQVFNNIIGKQWYDSCGNTSLGIKAYSFYFKSQLKNIYTASSIKLLLKCIIRKIKN